ncbi:MAG: hypothetical protein ACHQHN_18935 [Sphingobacteriales bacterium]
MRSRKYLFCFCWMLALNANAQVKHLVLISIDGLHPDMRTGFIAAGAGIIKGGHIRSLSEPDIAILIAQLLGINFKTPDGKLVAGILK